MKSFVKDKITLLHCDCMEYMKDIPDNHFSLGILDPPYQNNDAIGISNGKSHSAKRTNYHQFENIAPSQEYFNEVYRICKKWIIWGGNYFGLKGGAIVWNKHGTAFGEGEIAICNTHHSVRFFDFTWNGMIQENMKNKEDRFHPTQKPVQLYKWLLKNYATPDMKIIDTHLGSGSSAIAAHDFGCEFVGMEIDEEYFDSAVKRFDMETRQQKMF